MKRIKRVLVTGAARHLGRATALALAKKGYCIVCHYRKSKKEAEKVAKECREHGVEAEILQGDFSTSQSVQAFIKSYLQLFPATFGLVNNVGNYLVKGISKTTNEEWLSLFQTNLHAPIRLIQALLPSIKKEKGRIVNVGTAGIQLHLVSHTATAYYATKLALYSATLGFAKELAPAKVTVNMISPGYLETSIDLKDPRALPMKRAATAEEVAEMITLLFDEKASYITGQDIEIAGGIRL